MKTSDSRFQEAALYAFKKVFPALCIPVEELLNINQSYTAGTPEWDALLSSICMMVFGGLKTMTKFHSYANDTRDDVESFVARFFPEDYRWQFKKLYRSYEQGLLHCLGHEHLAEHALVFSDESRNDGTAFEQTTGGVLRVNVRQFYEDFSAAVNKFEVALMDESATAYRDAFYRNYGKILAACKLK